MDGLCRCPQTENQTELIEREYAFCYIFIFIHTWAFGSGYISTRSSFAPLFIVVPFATC